MDALDQGRPVMLTWGWARWIRQPGSGGPSLRLLPWSGLASASGLLRSGHRTGLRADSRWQDLLSPWVVCGDRTHRAGTVQFRIAPGRHDDRKKEEKIQDFWLSDGLTPVLPTLAQTQGIWLDSANPAHPLTQRRAALPRQKPGRSKAQTARRVTSAARSNRPESSRETPPLPPPSSERRKRKPAKRRAPGRRSMPSLLLLLMRNTFHISQRETRPVGASADRRSPRKQPHRSDSPPPPATAAAPGQRVCPPASSTPHRPR